MAPEPGDQQLRSLLAELSKQAREERFRTVEEVAATDSKLTFELTNLISRAGIHDRPAPADGLLPEVPVRYQLMNRIGQGAFGTVFHAFDRERQAHVAVKWLHRLEPDALYRFKQEFRSLADIRHPNLIRLYDLFQHGSSWFFTMELVQGESILRYVRPGARVRLDRLQEAFGALLAVTDYLHRCRVIHRDLKPGNILVDELGRLVVLDFGLVLHLRPGSDSGTGVLGTPAYMAPEQVSNGKITEAIDWYAVGVTLYQALTGRFPFEGSMLEVFVDKAVADPPAPGELAPDIPAEWNDLCMSLLSRNPEARAPASRHFLSSGRGVQPVLSAATAEVVGREDVLDLLFHACSRILSGKVSVIELSGPSGYGKTRILDAFARAVADRFPAAFIVRARCYEHESVPFKAADEMMDQVSRELRRLGEGAARYLPEDFDLLARLFPVFDLVKSNRENANENVVATIVNPQEVRRRAFLAIVELLQKLSAARILVICLDDLHWGDADSAALFDRLLHADPVIPFVLVASYRSDTALSPFLQTWRTNLSAPDDRLRIQRIEIGPLPVDAARKVALAMFGDTPGVAADVIDALVEESRGEPLLLEQLVANYKHGGIPEPGVTMQQILKQTVSRLSVSAHGVLCTLAAAGEPLPESMILRLAGSDIDRSRALASLIEERLVRRREVSGRIELEIYHDRIRAALIEQLPEDRLRALHSQIANGLVDIGFPDAGVIATHFARSDNSEGAIAYALKGAVQAEAVFAFDRAARLYRMALELGVQNRQQQCELYERMANAHASANRLSDAVDAYLEAAKRAGTRTRRAALEHRAGEELLRGGKLREGVDLLKSAGADLRIRQTENAPLALASIVYFRVKLAIRGLNRSRTDHTKVPDEVLRRLDLYWALTAGLSVLNPPVGFSAQLRYLDLALRTGNPRRIALGLAAQAAFLSLRGERAYKQSRKPLEQALETGARLKDPLVMGTALAFDSVCGYMMGRWNQAKDSGERAERILREQCAGVSWQLNVAQGCKVGGLILLGEWAPLPKMMAELIEDAQSRGDLISLGTFLGNQFLPLLTLDQPEKALTGLLEAERLLASTWSGKQAHSLGLMGVWGRIMIASYSGTAMSVKPEVDALLKRVKRSPVLWVETFSSLTTTHEGIFCVSAAMDKRLSGSERNDLLARAKACAGRLEKHRASWSAAQSQLVRGSIAAANQEPERACMYWAEAEREFERHSMKLHAAAVRFGRARLSSDKDLEATAETQFRAQGVIRPDSMARALAPGAV